MSRVLIADDHFPVRIGLQLLVIGVLGAITTVDFASDGREVMEKVGEFHYDILITDVNMPETDCMQMIEAVLQKQPQIKILVVSVNPETIFALRFIRAGVYGYIYKGDSDSELKKAIYSISLGKKYLTKSQHSLIVDGYPDNKVIDNPFTQLSEREFEVAILLLKGNGAIEIAKLLSLSPSTASTYKGRIFEKLQVSNLMDLNVLARRYQIVNDDLLLH